MILKMCLLGEKGPGWGGVGGGGGRGRSTALSTAPENTGLPKIQPLPADVNIF